MMSVPLLMEVAAALSVSCDALTREDDRNVKIENICRMVAGQSEASLAHLGKIVETCIAEYGEIEKL